MGNLKINKVKYSGGKYFFESPIFESGINIIVGDNGSGKSTFSHFVDFGLGGNVLPFRKDSKNDKYKKITEDNNNYVELDISINQTNYILKRFIDTNDIFIKEQNDNESIIKLPVIRRPESPNIFSDWLLEKLNISKFQLNLGATSWYFNFNDLFRLLYYDQDTELKKIYKNPSSENFVTDSVLIRKSIFEILVGISSNEYFKALNELKKVEKEKEVAEEFLKSFLITNPNVTSDAEAITNEVNELILQLEKLTYERDLYQKQNTKVDKKTEHLTEIQTSIIDLELAISENTRKRNDLNSEKIKIESLLKNVKQEISQIEKIIFTHDKLNLFSLEVCPFCMSTDIKKEEGYCICHSRIEDADYEKFVYKSSEYKDILKHKQKNIDTINIALESYIQEIAELSNKVEIQSKQVISLKEKLTKIIMSIEFSGNSQFIDELNNKIIEIKEELFKKESLLKLTNEKIRLKNAFDEKEFIYKDKREKFRKLENQFESNNKKIIGSFNEIFNTLMNNSSYKSEKAEIDDNYMPHIDGGEYKQKSADVPKRMMYYFTLLCLALKYITVKHPKFVLFDTPETVGIDKNNLDINIKQLETIMELAKDSNGKIPDFQIILTTGYGKYPDDYEKFVRLKFNKMENKYILKEKNIIT